MTTLFETGEPAKVPRHRRPTVLKVVDESVAKTVCKMLKRKWKRGEGASLSEMANWAIDLDSRVWGYIEGGQDVRDDLNHASEADRKALADLLGQTAKRLGILSELVRKPYAR